MSAVFEPLSLSSRARWAHHPGINIAAGLPAAKGDIVGSCNQGGLKGCTADRAGQGAMSPKVIVVYLPLTDTPTKTCSILYFPFGDIGASKVAIWLRIARQRQHGIAKLRGAFAQA